MYDELTKSPIKIGNYTFEFDEPTDRSFLCNFKILKNYIGIFTSDYLLKKVNDKVIIRIKTKSNQKHFRILKQFSHTNPLYQQDMDYYEGHIQDFLYLLSSEQWVVE